MKKIVSNIYASTEYPEINIGFIVGSEGVIAVDAPTMPQDARAWRQMILDMTDLPIMYTVLTDAEPHRILSAGELKAPIVATRAAYKRAVSYTDGFWRNVVRKLKRRYPEEEKELSKVNVVLPEILFSGKLKLHKAGAEVNIQAIAGNAPGSAWVDMRDEGVIFLGDTMVVGTPPIMEETPDTKAWLSTLTKLRRPRFADIALVPGRGSISDHSVTRQISEFIRLARRRMRSLHRTGGDQKEASKFVDELLALFPTADEEQDQLDKRVKSGLERVYEELAPPSDDE